MSNHDEVALRSAISVLQRLLPSGNATPVSANCPVHRFVQTHLTTDTGQALTTQSIVARYSVLASEGKAPRLSERVVERRLPAAIAMSFGVRKSHSVIEAGRFRRGYVGLTFVSASQ